MMDLDRIEQCPNSLYLEVRNLQVAGSRVASAIRRHAALRYVTLERNSFRTDGRTEVFEALMQLRRLETLQLPGNAFPVENLVALLGKFDMLSKLDVSLCGLTDTAMTQLCSAIASHASLTSLNVASNNFCSDGSQALAYCTRLRSLDVSHNMRIDQEALAKLVRTSCYLTLLRAVKTGRGSHILAAAVDERAAKLCALDLPIDQPVRLVNQFLLASSARLVRLHLDCIEGYHWAYEPDAGKKLMLGEEFARFIDALGECDVLSDFGFNFSYFAEDRCTKLFETLCQLKRLRALTFCVISLPMLSIVAPLLSLLHIEKCAVVVSSGKPGPIVLPHVKQNKRLHMIEIGCEECIALAQAHSESRKMIASAIWLMLLARKHDKACILRIFPKEIVLMICKMLWEMRGM
jgi:hypothetical protein